LHPTLVRHIILPLHERLRHRRTMRYYAELGDQKRRGPEGLRALQLRKLRALLAHCVAEVPFYRERLRASDLEPGDATPEALAQLPSLERDDIRANREEMVAESYRERLIRYSTGGSTGQPLVFYTDLDKEARHNAYKLRCRAWHGILPGDRQVDFWGSPIELDKRSRFRIWKDRWLLNQELLSAFDLTDERLASYVDHLRRGRPRLVYGYPTVIYRVAQFVLAHPGTLGGWRPALVSCTSEMLYDHQRATIREAFGCPVANEYGSRDGGLIAHECPEGRMHIVAEHVIVEVNAPGEDGVGDLLVTNLDAYGMPLLRYRLGDRAALEPGTCDCGLPLPLLGKLAGRSNDFLVGAGGKFIHSLAPIYVLREIAEVRQFKLTQRRDLSLRIDLVCAEPLDGPALENIRAKMGKVFGFDIPVQFSFPDAIPPEKSGKYRWVVSEASSSPQLSEAAS
jgi:phenylacetate-CoA ligase